jgi:hypothetical protein
MVEITTIDFPDRSTCGIVGARRKTAVDWNEYVVVVLVRERLAEARADAERRARLPRRPSRRVRRRAGEALIRLGRRLAGEGVVLDGLPEPASRG